MKIVGELTGGDSECVCVSEIMEIVGELEESEDEKVSDCATLLLKRMYGKSAKIKGDGSGGVSVDFVLCLLFWSGIKVLYQHCKRM
jgi:hypothetical protein